MSVPAGWEGILEEGEKILWQGRPDGRLRIGLRHVASFLFGLLFAGFALLWMIMAAAAGGLFWSFGLIHFTIGLGVALGPLAADVIRRRNTWYTLTDRRAFIATDLPLVGRGLKSWPITPNMPLELAGDDPPSLFFAEEYRRGRHGPRRVPVGFEAIPDAPEVMALIRKIQKGRA